MKNRFLYISLILLSFPFLSMNTFSQRIEKKIDKSFTAQASTTISVESKFGEVRVLKSESSAIQVNAVMWVEGKNEKQAKELLSDMGVDISQTGSDISIKSNFPEISGSRNGLKFQIDITIEAPTQVNLNLKSRYGSTYIAEIDGLLNVDIAYGSLQAGIFGRKNEKPLNQLNLSYSSASVENAGWLKTELAYSKLSITKANAIVAVSKYSVLSVEDCSSLATQSKYDTYKATRINNYVGNHSYCNVKITELSKLLEVTSSYTNVKVDMINAGFESIKVSNTRGNYRLGVSRKSSFTLNGAASRGEVAVNGMDKLEKRQENADKFISGQYGTNPTGKIELKSVEGSVIIDLN